METDYGLKRTHMCAGLGINDVEKCYCYGLVSRTKTLGSNIYKHQNKVA